MHKILLGLLLSFSFVSFTVAGELNDENLSTLVKGNTLEGKHEWKKYQFQMYLAEDGKAWFLADTGSQVGDWTIKRCQLCVNWSHGGKFCHKVQTYRDKYEGYEQGMMGRDKHVTTFSVSNGNPHDLVNKVKADQDKTLEITFKGLNGESFSLDKSNMKPTAIYIWASWCRNCIEGLRDFQKLHTGYSGKGLIVVGISTDDREKKAKEFSDDKGVTFPNAWRKSESYKDNLPKKLKVPTVILVDNSGKIVTERKGGMLLSKIEDWANKVLN